MCGVESQGRVVVDGAIEASRGQILVPCGTGSYLQLLSTGDVILCVFKDDHLGFVVNTRGQWWAQGD